MICFAQAKFSSKDTNAKELYLKPLKERQKKRLFVFSYDIKSLPKTAIYSRYADEWGLLVTGTKQKAENYQRLISVFIKNTLKIYLDPAKTLISRLDDGISFLKFTIKR